MNQMTYRQMADEIKAVGWEKTDSLEKGRKLKRAPEMLALIEYRIQSLRSIWAFLDGLAKADESVVEPPAKPATVVTKQPIDDDDF